MTSRLQTAIDRALTEKNIDLILPALQNTQLFAVCTEEDGQAVIWFVPSQENSSIAVITASEHLAWLEAAFAQNPARGKMMFRAIEGADIAAMGLNERVEVYIQFEEQAYKIPRSYFEHWAAIQPA